MEILLKSINRLENYTAKYIYKKYLTNFLEVQNHDLASESFDKYLDTIFSKDRKAIITQKEYLDMDLENMSVADKDYEMNPEQFKPNLYDSLPDIKRCSFIRKHKNKYKRCCNSIMNKDEDMCYKHIEKPNMYWDRWCEVLEENKKEDEKEDKIDQKT
uniref:Uncharacterized protein n=1 Tax=viral metagenome TaxID=1070528 RepID=A0A6C0EXG1_9ZZZZ